jgi:hypothetical protein
MDLEARLDEELGLLGVTPHITHLRGTFWSYYPAVTVATIDKEHYTTLDSTLSIIYRHACEKKSNIGTVAVDMWAERRAGVALCHYLDNFSRKRGRIIAKGRLLKILRARRRDE